MEIDVNDNNFNEEVMESDMLCVVDFWAEWCGPCQMIAPILGEIAKTYEGQLKLCKLNVDGNSQTTSKYKIMHIPVILIFKNGELVEQIIGLRTKEEIESKIKPFIN